MELVKMKIKKEKPKQKRIDKFIDSISKDVARLNKELCENLEEYAKYIGYPDPVSAVFEYILEDNPAILGLMWDKKEVYDELVIHMNNWKLWKQKAIVTEKIEQLEKELKSIQDKIKE